MPLSLAATGLFGAATRNCGYGWQRVKGRPGQGILSQPPRSVPAVPRVSAFYGIVVYMYPSDHPPPHFHAEYGEHQALIVIADGRVFAGSLPRRALRLVREWRRLHQDELEEAWERLSGREHPGSIDPLP